MFRKRLAKHEKVNENESIQVHAILFVMQMTTKEKSLKMIVIEKINQLLKSNR